MYTHTHTHTPAYLCSGEKRLKVVDIATHHSMDNLNKESCKRSKRARTAAATDHRYQIL